MKVATGAKSAHGMGVEKGKHDRKAKDQIVFIDCKVPAKEPLADVF